MLRYKNRKTHNPEVENEEDDLTPMEWALYRYLEAKTLGNDEKVSQYEIYRHMRELGYDVTWNDSQNQHNDHCRWLYNLILDINFSLRVDHIIVHDRDYKYRLGSEDETLAYWHSFYEKYETNLGRHVLILEKIKRHGQGELISNAGEPITAESMAKRFHETFNKAKKEEVPA